MPVSLGALEKVRATRQFRLHKRGYKQFVLWILDQMGRPEVLTGRDVNVRLYLGRDLYDPIWGDPSKEMGWAYGLAYARKRPRFGTRHTIHLSVRTLCDPIQLASTVVHEFEHLRDYLTMAQVRKTQGAVIANYWLQNETEKNAERAEARFWLYVRESHVRAAFQRFLPNVCG